MITYFQYLDYKIAHDIPLTYQESVDYYAELARLLSLDR
jgi:hypothetical protein